MTLLLVAFLVRDARGYLAGKIAAALFVCSIGYSLMLLHDETPLPPLIFRGAVALNIFNLALGWVFTRALLEDGFKLTAPVWAVFAAISLTIAAADADVFGLTPPGHETIERLSVVVSLAVMAHMLWMAISGYRNDLLNVRRTVRAWFVIFVVMSFGALIALEAMGASSAVLGVTYDITTIIIVVTLFFWSARFRAERLFTKDEAPAVAPAVKPAGDNKHHRRLMEIMAVEKAFREPTLSVASLAGRMALPPHKLRELINAELGYRNFAAYVNGYRIEQAAQELATPALAEKSILAIAMDCGFQTLSTFNRAFKAIKNETPSAFRKRALEQAHSHAAPEAAAEAPQA